MSFYSTTSVRVMRVDKDLLSFKSTAPPRIGPMGMAFSWRGCSLQTIPPVGRRSPVEDPGLCDPPGGPGGSVGSVFDSGPMC